MKDGLTSVEVETLYRRYGAFVRRRCRVLVRDPMLADDAVQEAFVNVLRRGEELRRADEPLRFLYRVADRACFDQLRRLQRSPQARSDSRHGAGDGALDGPAHPAVDPVQRRAAIELLGRLDAESQQIAVMAFVDGMTQEEIGVELGYSRMTIIKRIAAIRADADAWAADTAAKTRRQEAPR